MGYELHIERQAEVLAYDDWLAAIDAVDGVRLATGDMTIKDSETGQVNSWKLPEGTAEMQFADEWIPVFYWGRRGSVRFKLGDEAERVLQTALALASRLEAQVVSDEGTEYTCLDDLVPPEFR